MIQKNLLGLPTTLLAFLASPALALLPYNPTRIISSSNGSFAYLFAPQPSSSEFSLTYLDTSNTIASSNVTSIVDSDLPFLSKTSSKAFIPLANDDGDMTVLAGNCNKGAQGLELWKFTPSADKKSGIWTNLALTLTDATLSANYLSAGFLFSPTDSITDSSVYVFGGMCPQTDSSDASDWTLDATYSNTMLTLSPGSASGSGPYDTSLTGQRAPPIAEAGLSITPLTPTYTNTSTGNASAQQNFVLIGGHTQNAFINMSQLALFSLPEESWAFLGIDQPVGSDSSTELFARDNSQVEPRSGHTAVMTPDGSRIVVFGGWVGNIDTPASPQLAVLQIGQGYGGTGNWAWTIPSQVSDPFVSGDGLYGHGATMLPGGIMMISGGYKISASGSKTKRETSDQFRFFNTTSSSWMKSYTNPSHVASLPGSSNSLKSTSQKAGLGVGLGIAIAVVAALLIFWLVYRRRLHQKRAERVKELRELALGADRYNFASLVGGGGMDGRGDYPRMETRFPEMRSASWGGRQEQSIEDSGDAYPWAPVISPDQAERMRLEREGEDASGLRHAERTGLLMSVPSPTRGLRRSLHSRGPSGFGANFGPAPGGAPSVFRIDEEEEGSQGGSLKGRAKTPNRDALNRMSDPFKDPPALLLPLGEQRDPAAAERKKEVQGWVDDWSAAAESMNISRNPSKATTNNGRTLSSLSHSQSNSQSGSGESQSGRGSPEKSDRTGSNLSERSMMSSYSIQQSQTGTMSRNVSTKSASAGYALFAGAAAAMALKVRGDRPPPPPAHAEYGTVNTGRGSMARAPSKRSTSLNFNSTGSSSGRPGTSDRCDTFSSARTSLGPILPGEDHSLLSRMNLRTLADEKEYWATPPQSPIKNRRADSFGSQAGRKALDLLGSVRRVFTGTGGVDVQDRVAVLEGRSGQSSPSKHSDQPDMAEVGPRRTVSASAAFWRGKRGAKDWDHEGDGIGTDVGVVENSGTIRRKPVPGQRVAIAGEGSEDEDWDVETAIQNRVVQVMFTVPKEKLRVVNADALSLMSKSDVDFEGGENVEGEAGERNVKRMSSVREGDEVEVVGLEGVGKGEVVGMDNGEVHEGKGKEREIEQPVRLPKFVFER